MHSSPSTAHTGVPAVDLLSPPHHPSLVGPRLPSSASQPPSPLTYSPPPPVAFPFHGLRPLTLTLHCSRSASTLYDGPYFRGRRAISILFYRLHAPPTFFCDHGCRPAVGFLPARRGNVCHLPCPPAGLPSPPRTRLSVYRQYVRFLHSFVPPSILLYTRTRTHTSSHCKILSLLGHTLPNDSSSLSFKSG